MTVMGLHCRFGQLMTMTQLLSYQSAELMRKPEAQGLQGSLYVGLSQDTSCAKCAGCEAGSQESAAGICRAAAELAGREVVLQA